MKKTVIFLLMLSIAFGIFSGCGNNTETKTTVSDAETTSSVVTESTEKKPQNQVITTGTTVYSDTNYTYHSIVYQTEKKTDKKPHIDDERENWFNSLSLRVMSIIRIRPKA